MGGLTDEYTFDYPTYAGAEFSAANVTALSTPDTIPWKHMVTPGKEIPSAPNSGGVGLFEGADYNPTGKYRPTANCAMASGVRFCPICTRELEIRIHDMGVPVPVAVPLSPTNGTTGATPNLTWQPQPGVSHYLVEVERQSSGQLVASFDVYATSFTLTPPLPAGTYRWRLRAGSTTNWADWSAWSPFTVSVAPPTISALSPARGRVAGGTPVLITGSNFLVGATTVTIGGQPATGVVVAGPTTLTAVAPAGPVGASDVVVSTFAGTATAGGAFTYFVPTYRYLAEGATSSLFNTQLALLNPGPTATTATLTFSRVRASAVVSTVQVPAHTRVTVNPKTITGMSTAEFSTKIESDQPLVVDRTLSWSVAYGYGAHAETAVTAPALTWYLAEGATHSGFSLFYLLQNPNATTSQVRVRFLRPSGAPLEKTYTLPANSRNNIWVNEEDFAGLGKALAATDVSAVFEVLNDQPIIVERALYLDLPGQTFGAGHESAGVTAPALEWFLAEGNTGPYFDLFVLIANPGNVDAEIEATYLLPDGTVIVKPQTVARNSRFNIWVDREDPRLVNTAVSTTIRSTNGVPVIVERALWWPGSFGQWYEAHNSPGATSTGTRWALAEGEVGGTRGVETYLLLANTSAAPGKVRVTLLFEDGTSAVREFDVAARSRFNVDARIEFPAALNKRFGAIVESLGATPAQIVVERAMYWDALGQHWAAGTNALATKLQ